MRTFFTLALCVLSLAACNGDPVSAAHASTAAPAANLIGADTTDATFGNLQVFGDMSVGGMVDFGQTGTGALSIGPGYVDVGGAPLSVRQGVVFYAVTAPPARTDGPTLFFNFATRKLSLRMAVVDGGGLVALH